MPKRNQKTGDLSNTINNIKKEISSGFDEILSRVEKLEYSDAKTAMEIRNIKIQLMAQRGEKQSNLANAFDLSEGRISQIVRNI